MLFLYLNPLYAYILAAASITGAIVTDPVALTTKSFELNDAIPVTPVVVAKGRLAAPVRPLIELTMLGAEMLPVNVAPAADKLRLASNTVVPLIEYPAFASNLSDGIFYPCYAPEPPTFGDNIAFTFRVVANVEFGVTRNLHPPAPSESIS